MSAMVSMWLLEGIVVVDELLFQTKCEVVGSILVPKKGRCWKMASSIATEDTLSLSYNSPHEVYTELHSHVRNPRPTCIELRWAEAWSAQHNSPRPTMRIEQQP